MTCPVCEAPLELVSHDRYRGLRFPGASLFRAPSTGLSSSDAKASRR